VRRIAFTDLTADQFADMYAQTICYGLFAARVNTPPKTSFRRELAAYDIPKTNPFLRKMFGYIAGPDLDERVVWAVDDLAEVLNRTNMESILHDFGKRTRQEDPVVHFYETFLAEYDPKMREARGVYYTPEPVVSYIVRSVDYLLKKDFDLPDGLADATKISRKTADGKSSIETHKVQILDPATGTGTFLHSVIDNIYETFRGNKGLWSAYVSQHLLSRIFGFELLMVPYAVAHMKLGLQLKETGYDFKGQERLGVYLTNTLEEGFGEGNKLPFVEWLVEEATAAGSVKQEVPVMVVLGNPPYSGHSANKGKWINELLHSKGSNYFEVDGKPLGERNPKYLNDDYVKFIWFAQWRIQRTGYGILAFITNHGYLDNPTFRGMRQSLMYTFNDIYVLNLHGNSKKREHTPDGTKDENVFDIQQGVAIGVFVKRQEKANTSRVAAIYHAELWGLREVYAKVDMSQKLIGGKYHWLAEHNIKDTQWLKIEPQSPLYLFVPQGIDLKDEYERGWKLTRIMPVNSTGVKTHRDHFVVGFDLPTVKKRLDDFRNLSIPDEVLAELYDLQDTREWKLTVKRRVLFSDTHEEDHFVKILYRPFDIRPFFHHEALIDRPRREVMRHMLAGENLGLIGTRQTRDSWDTFAANTVIDHKSLAAYDTNTFFPLYLYPDSKKDTLFDINEPSDAPGGRQPNLSPELTKDICYRLKMQFFPDGKGDLQKNFGPEDIFDYIYAITYSPTYRIRYAEFLKIDFLHLPLTSNADLFRQLCKLGERLARLHLMEQIDEAIEDQGGWPVE
jgi:predicted helicase